MKKPVNCPAETEKDCPDPRRLQWSQCWYCSKREAAEKRTLPAEMMRREAPKCLHCSAPLPREIKVTGVHHESCPWNYYIECEKCGYENNLSKLLGFGAGCSDTCERGGEPDDG